MTPLFIKLGPGYIRGMLTYFANRTIFPLIGKLSMACKEAPGESGNIIPVLLLLLVASTTP